MEEIFEWFQDIDTVNHKIYRYFYSAIYLLIFLKISNGILWHKIEIQTRNCQFQVYKNSMSSGCGNHCSIKTFYQLNIEEHAQ